MKVIIESNKAKAVRDWDGRVTGGKVEAWKLSGGKKGAKLDIKGCLWSGNQGEDAAEDTVRAQVDSVYGEGNWERAYLTEQYGSVYA